MVDKVGRCSLCFSLYIDSTLLAIPRHFIQAESESPLSKKESALQSDKCQINWTHMVFGVTEAVIGGQKNESFLYNIFIFGIHRTMTNTT